MRITASILHQKWDAINYYDGAYTQVATDSALEWYVGYKDINMKALLLLSKKEPELSPSSKSVLVEKGCRESDGRWALSMALLRPEQQGVFETLCADIIEYSGEEKDEAQALDLMSKRFKQWNRLLEHQRKSLMDESNRKGLLGEVTYLWERISSGYPILAAIQGWVGPDGADQDFVYQDGWHEVKSVGIATTEVMISSLEQLCCKDVGELVVMRIDKCAPEHSNSISLAGAVERVIDLARADTDALTLLEGKLARYGYIDLPEYKEQKYVYSGKQRFCVDEDFPRLTADSVPTQIVSAHYALSLSGIESWKVEG